MEQKRQFTVSNQETGIRLDVCLAGRFPEFTRSYLQKLCKDFAVSVEGAVKKSNYKVREGEQVSLDIPEPTELSIKPEKMDLDIVYEDQDIILGQRSDGALQRGAFRNQWSIEAWHRAQNR